MKARYFLILMGLVLSACVAEPVKTLDEKLAYAASPSERRDVLRRACLDEAEWPLRNVHHYRLASAPLQQRLKQQYHADVSQTKALCRKMDEYARGGVRDDRLLQRLVFACGEIVSAKKRDNSQGSAEHAVRMQAICGRMTSAGGVSLK